MPELPEVEVTRLGISSAIVGNTLCDLHLHSPKLSAMVPADLAEIVRGQRVASLKRRGKYLVLECASGSLLLHLGMTGHLRMVPVGRQPGKHDTLDILFGTGTMLRLNDTRRFGRIDWTSSDPLQHALLAGIGPEPLTDAFSGDYLFRKSRNRKVAIQRFLMDSAVVAGVGNIYAAESLFRCGLLPTPLAADLDEEQCQRLALAVKEVLTASIAAGTSTMDFFLEEEKLAYFPQELNAYDREGEPCRVCGAPIVRGRLGNRSTFYCGECQR